MGNQSKTASKEEIISRVMELSEKGLGCRRIAAILQSEGVDTSKDTVWRIRNEHKAKGKKTEIEQDAGFTCLKQKAEFLQRRLNLQQKKEEYRKQIVDLTVELMMTSYEKRKKLFSNSENPLHFAEKAMKVRNPSLWNDFLEFCKGRSDVAVAVSTAVGRQEIFEQQLAERTVGQRLDIYVETRFEKSLNSWTKPLEEKLAELEEHARKQFRRF